jgi:hypothetical protein
VAQVGSRKDNDEGGEKELGRRKIEKGWEGERIRMRGARGS